MKLKEEEEEKKKHTQKCFQDIRKCCSLEE